MLHWKVTHVKENCHYECVRRKRHCFKNDFTGIMLIVAALLVLLLILPAWVIAILVCTALIALGLIWILS